MRSGLPKIHGVFSLAAQTSSNPVEVRVAAARALSAVARAGAWALWAPSGWWFEEVQRTAVGALEDSEPHVRATAASLLGELAACGRSHVAGGWWGVSEVWVGWLGWLIGSCLAGNARCTYLDC